MGDVLRILICKTYQREVESIIQTEGWKKIEMQLLPQACISPQTNKNALNRIHQIQKVGDGHDIVIGGCLAITDSAIQGMDGQRVRTLDQCFSMLTNRSIVESLIQQGGYVLTPGWLAEWPAHLAEWGFNKETARSFFHECTHKLVLLDTGVYPESKQHLEGMGEYLNLPVESITVGTDYFRLFLSRIVADWEYEHSMQQTKEIIADMNRMSADHAMAFDILTDLTQATNETKAIEMILDMFDKLCPSEEISYHPILGGTVGSAIGRIIGASEEEAVQRWALSNIGDYAWTTSGNGFFLRFRHFDETMGVLRQENIQMMQYKQQFLNLALSIAPLCGLTIANARTFQKLQDAEKTARREKEISETLREVTAELTMQLNLDEVLQQILISLYRVLSYTDAAIFLLEGTELHYVAGRKVSDEGNPIPYSPPFHSIQIESILDHDQPFLFSDLTNNIGLQSYFGGERLQSMINVPLVLRGDLLGLLSLGNQSEESYGESEVMLAQSFANEASIAIENARLFKELQVMATTDGLTGLYNRRYFYKIADLEFKRSSRYNRPLSMVMLDIDFFKRINDTYGHPAGDQVLSQVADCCRKNVRAADILGRYGGEEFCLMLPETDEENALSLAERLRRRISEMNFINIKDPVHVTVSEGIACFRPDCATLEDLLRRCDEALYDAKHSGRNCVRIWGK
jgi:diguanylate cyclase (GGDEF)-like protein